ncbi:5'/3'-nucleotidase SurE [Oricola cellulosilytica]|uniref:5'-nucleotidase SurE n=1 Tax=Oricola cellulosilytica TaxID=1429082 RepID=A0A4R0P8P6_9HYPH|nr:5'/3'-nucleotidase SurE [Oricola cellulosilytica]TCD12351.1 5'/3'-nucleotidase SurE [Oricola cellulosilytica]
MRILITNDDGIHAEGLAVLERIAATLSDDVWVVAPETDQSGLAHSLTINDPLRLRKISEKRFALRGTPTDCVIMAVTHVMGDKPDLVLSGVNSGANIADDVTYSGTVAGAMEGTLLGIRSIAVSQAYSFQDQRRLIPWEVAETHAPDLLKRLLGIELEPGTFLNVNFPNCPIDDVAGTVVTHQGKLLHGLSVEERADGRGFPYFWIRFGRSPVEAPDTSDIAALRRNMISVTPLKLDLTAHEAVSRLREALA